MNSNPPPRLELIEEASIAAVVTKGPVLLVLVKLSLVKPPTHNPPANKCSIPLLRGYSQEGTLGQFTQPLPYIPKFVTESPIFPTFAKRLSSESILLNFLSSV